jgi:hypothetical protein
MKSAFCLDTDTKMFGLLVIMSGYVLVGVCDALAVCW